MLNQPQRYVGGCTESCTFSIALSGDAFGIILHTFALLIARFHPIAIMHGRLLVHEEHFETTPETVFDLLIRPSAIRGWWGASQAIVLAESGGTWAATWGDDEDNPDYLTIARISTYDPPALLELSDYRYASKEGDLPFEAVFTTRFLCRAHGNGTVLRVEQTGFPMDQEAFYQACVQGWADTFVGIRRFLSDRD